jgi:hypothetical protein
MTILQFDEGLRENQSDEFTPFPHQRNIVIETLAFARKNQAEYILQERIEFDAGHRFFDMLADGLLGEQGKSILRAQQHADIASRTQTE